MALTNIAKHTSSLTNRTLSAPTLTEQFLMIDDTYFLLIDDTYRLQTQSESAGTALTNIAKH